MALSLWMLLINTRNPCFRQPQITHSRVLRLRHREYYPGDAGVVMYDDSQAHVATAMQQRHLRLLTVAHSAGSPIVVERGGVQLSPAARAACLTRSIGLAFALSCPLAPAAAALRCTRVHSCRTVSSASLTIISITGRTIIMGISGTRFWIPRMYSQHG